MKMQVTEFKSKCTHILREIAAQDEIIEITSRGKVIALITPPPVIDGVNPLCGRLQGSVTYRETWDDPLGEQDWDACT